MAINYTNLFEDVGKLIKAHNQILDAALGTNNPRPNLPALRSEIISTFTGNNNATGLLGIPELFDRFRDQVTTLTASLRQRVVNRLLDEDTVLSQLPGLGSSVLFDDVISELLRDMGSQNISFKKSVVGATVVDNVANQGNGSLLVDFTLDGISDPRVGYYGRLNYLGSRTQLSTNEVMTLTCVADSDVSRTTLYEEVFRLEGLRNDGPFGWRNRGSGETLEFSSLYARQQLTNGFFTGFSSTSGFSGWDNDFGTVGTHIQQETTLSNTKLGDSALKLVNSSSAAVIQVSQTLGDQTLQPLKRYCLAAYVKGNSELSSGYLTIKLSSPSGGYVATSDESILIGLSDLSDMTDYELHHAYFTLPRIVPSDLEVIVSFSSTPTNAKPIWISGLVLGEVTYANGLGLVLIPNSQQWGVSDRYQVNVTNNEAGVFQTFFAKAFQVQLPTSDAATIDDALAV